VSGEGGLVGARCTRGSVSLAESNNDEPHLSVIAMLLRAGADLDSQYINTSGTLEWMTDTA
jgi:hypothetical protein